MSRSIYRYKLFFMMIMVAVVVLVAGLLISSFARRAQAGSFSDQQIRYESYVVEPGDTLWSIADRYTETVFSSREAYIDEVKRVNQLTSSNIYEGDLLALPGSDYEVQFSAASE